MLYLDFADQGISIENLNPREYILKEALRHGGGLEVCLEVGRHGDNVAWKRLECFVESLSPLIVADESHSR